MRFEVQGTAPIDDPTPEQVERGLRALDRDGSDYAILERQPSTYLQTAPAGDGTYVLEVQDGSLDRHYRASSPLQVDDLVAAFDGYLRQDAAWRSRHEWQPMDLQSRQAAPPPRRPRRAARSRVRAREAPRGWSPLVLVVWYVVLGLACLTFALAALRSGVTATLAGTGAAGQPGLALVTSCTGRFGDSCTGLYTPIGGAVLPSRVPVAGGPYRTPQLLPDVRLLNGEAFPPVGGMIADLLFDYVAGTLLLAGAVSCATLLVRRRARAAQSVV